MILCLECSNIYMHIAVPFSGPEELRKNLAMDRVLYGGM